MWNCYTPVEEERLIRRIEGGDNTALQELYSNRDVRHYVIGSLRKKFRDIEDSVMVTEIYPDTINRFGRWVRGESKAKKVFTLEANIGTLLVQTGYWVAKEYLRSEGKHRDNVVSFSDYMALGNEDDFALEEEPILSLSDNISLHYDRYIIILEECLKELSLNCQILLKNKLRFIYKSDLESMTDEDLIRFRNTPRISVKELADFLKYTENFTKEKTRRCKNELVEKIKLRLNIR